MSKRSYLCIAIMLAALLYMGAVRAHQWYARQKLEWENERQESVGAFSFQQVPVSLAAPQAEPMAEPVLFSTSAAQAATAMSSTRSRTPTCRSRGFPSEATSTCAA